MVKSSTIYVNKCLAKGFKFFSFTWTIVLHILLVWCVAGTQLNLLSFWSLFACVNSQFPYIRCYLFDPIFKFIFKETLIIQHVWLYMINVNRVIYLQANGRPLCGGDTAHCPRVLPRRGQGHDYNRENG